MSIYNKGTHQDGQQHQEHEEEVESSNANRDGDPQEAVADGTARETTAASNKDLLEAMKVMGDQVAVMAQLFTPLVNYSVGQATPVRLSFVRARSLRSCQTSVRARSLCSDRALGRARSLRSDRASVRARLATEPYIDSVVTDFDPNTGQTSQAAADGANLSGLRTDPVATNLKDEHEEEVESSNANRDGDQQEAVADGTSRETTAASNKDLLEAMKVMGDQVAVMAQLFTPLVNSSVGQATPVKKQSIDVHPVPSIDVETRNARLGSSQL
ncbi:hypothetical protein F2Q69_00043062 [Brassica cretica]|uniref:Uncharacterized protein n=1 Tax=Brassica cretica TaxID=69181 RepID=A0A8S9NIG3_BRACR|nr:hypothetical protein F2Q69_00043062 [Brassica cretica]